MPEGGRQPPGRTRRALPGRALTGGFARTRGTVRRTQPGPRGAAPQRSGGVPARPRGRALGARPAGRDGLLEGTRPRPPWLPRLPRPVVPGGCLPPVPARPPAEGTGRESAAATAFTGIAPPGQSGVVRTNRASPCAAVPLASSRAPRTAYGGIGAAWHGTPSPWAPAVRIRRGPAVRAAARRPPRGGRGCSRPAATASPPSPGLLRRRGPAGRTGGRPALWLGPLRARRPQPRARLVQSPPPARTGPEESGIKNSGPSVRVRAVVRVAAPVRYPAATGR
jgi:hypothetical protein